MSVAPRANSVKVTAYTAKDLNEPLLDRTVGVRMPDRMAKGDLESSDEVHPHSRHKLGLWGLVAIIFFSVSGGPFGSEGSIGACGPLYALLGFVVFPFIWCVPEALMTAELGSLMPGGGGAVSWVTAAYGSYAGHMVFVCAWLSGMTDSGVYPHLLMSYVIRQFPDLESYGPWIICAIAVLLGMVNYLGVRSVGNLSKFSLVVILGPFLLIWFLGLKFIMFGSKDEVAPLDAGLGIGANLGTSAASGTNPSASSLGAHSMTELMNVLFWNLNYWDSVAPISAEVLNPQAVLPKALGIALVLVCGMYILSLSVGYLVLPDASRWAPGTFHDIGLILGGPILGTWVSIAATLSNIGQFHAELSADSYQYQAMVDLGWFPKFMGRWSSKFKSPVTGIIVQCTYVILLSNFSFMQLIEVLNVLYCFSVTVEFMSLVKLRKKYPNRERPFKIPITSDFGLYCLVGLPVSFALYMVLVSVYDGNMLALAWLGLALLIAHISYQIFSYLRGSRPYMFHRDPPEDLAGVLEALGALSEIKREVSLSGIIGLNDYVRACTSEEELQNGKGPEHNKGAGVVGAGTGSASLTGQNGASVMGQATPQTAAVLGMIKSIRV